jgi:hypothetical protein
MQIGKYLKIGGGSVKNDIYKIAGFKRENDYPGKQAKLFFQRKRLKKNSTGKI